MLRKLKQSALKITGKLNELVLLLLALPAPCFATDIGSVIDKATGYLQGGLAKSIGIGAIVVAGYLCIAKQMFPKMYFMSLLLGLGLIFGASSLYTTFVG